VKTANTQKVFKAFAEKTTKMAKSILRSKGKNASGNLEDSIGYNLKVYPSGALELQFKAAEYATFVDKGVSGTKRKFNTDYEYTTKQPPSNVIDKWVVRKGIKAGRDDKGRFIKRKSLVFAIARSIKLYGIEPTNFFTRAFNFAYKKLPVDVARAYAQDYVKFLRTVTGKI
tara:strand:+ start:3100 stop:3612 length:513 start_codon:yes stop_codon:yes gene_type:complete